MVEPVRLRTKLFAWLILGTLSVFFAEIVSGKYRLEDINEALANMASGKEIKPVIDNRGR